MFLACGAPVDVECNGNTPLAMATGIGSLEGMQSLVSKGANIQVIDSESGHNLVAYANTPEKIRFLVKKGVDVEGGQGKISPLMKRMLKGQVDCVKELMKLGAKTNDFTNEFKGTTPLHLAAYVNAIPVEMITTLVEGGIKPDVKGVVGTPLMVTRTAEKVRRLVELGANVNVNCTTTTTDHPRIDSPLSSTVCITAPVEVMNELLKHGADPLYIEPTTGNNLIHFVVQSEYSKEDVKVMVKKLVSLGVDINMVNTSGQTPVETARINKESEIEEILIAAGGHKYGKSFLCLFAPPLASLAFLSLFSCFPLSLLILLIEYILTLIRVLT